MKELLSQGSGVLFLIAYGVYIWTIVRGPSRPSKATWVIWAVLDAILLTGMAVSGALNGIIVGATMGAAIVAVLSCWRYGQPGWTTVDKLCSVGAALGIVAWLATSNPVFAIIISSAALVVGAVPTWRAAWRKPSNESRLAWSIFFSGTIASSIAVPKWDWANATQPLAFLVCQAPIVFCIFLRPRHE